MSSQSTVSTLFQSLRPDTHVRRTQPRCTGLQRYLQPSESSLASRQTSDDLPAIHSLSHVAHTRTTVDSNPDPKEQSGQGTTEISTRDPRAKQFHAAPRDTITQLVQTSGRSSNEHHGPKRLSDALTRTTQPFIPNTRLRNPTETNGPQISDVRRRKSHSSLMLAAPRLLCRTGEIRLAMMESQHRNEAPASSCARQGVALARHFSIA